MATQQIEFFAPSGLTLTVALYAAGSDIVAYTASAVVEQVNRKGVYRATFSGVAAGTYQLLALSGSIAVASYWGFAQDTATTFVFGEIAGNMTASASAELTAVKSKTDQLAFTVANQVDANALTGGGGLTQADVRTAVGLASPNLDAQLSAIAASSAPEIVISPAAVLHNEHFKTTPYNPNPLNVPWKAQKTFSISVYTLSESGEKVPVEMTGKTLRIVFENASGGDLAVLENASITKTANTFTFTNPAAAATPANSARKLTGKWSCRETSTDFAWAYGAWEVIDVAFKDA